MDPFAVPVLEGDRVAGTVQLQVQPETTADKESQLNKLLPRVSDAFVGGLHGYPPRLLRDKRRLDVDLIERGLAIIADRAIGKGLIDNLLIQSAIGRPVRAGSNFALN